MQQRESGPSSKLMPPSAGSYTSPATSAEPQDLVPFYTPKNEDGGASREAEARQVSRPPDKDAKKGSVLTRAIRIVLDADPDDRINLLEVIPPLKKFFINRKIHAAVRIIGENIFSFIIISGFLGPQDPSRNVALFIAWGMWWPSVVLSWFLLGRFWCGICPFPGIGRILQSGGYSFDLRIPRFLHRYGIYLAGFLFALILWAEETMGLKESPIGTAYLMLAILAGALICSIIFPGQAWCRYLCPMGRIIGVGSVMSFTELRADYHKCRTCTTFACRKGTEDTDGCPVYLGAVGVHNNQECLVCGKCISLCDKDSPVFNLRSPYVELIKHKGRSITCTYIIPLLMGSQLARYAQDGVLAHWIASYGPDFHMLIFTILLGTGFLFILAVVHMGGMIFGVTGDAMLGRFSPMVPVLVPISFAGELIIRLRYTLTHLPDFMPTLGRQFGMDLSSMTFPISYKFLAFLDISIFTSATLAGLHILFVFTEKEFKGLVTHGRYLLVIFLMIVVLEFYIVLGIAPILSKGF